MIRTALLVLSLLTWTSASVFDFEVQQPQSAFFQPCDTDLAHPHDVTYQPNIQQEFLAEPVSSSYDNNQVWRDRSMTDVVESSSSNVEIDDASNQPEPSHKSMHLMQASQMFTMERLTARAPWSTRIQPALQYRQNTIRYTQRGTGIVINAAANSLHMFEGGFTQSFNGTNMIENDIWISQGGSDGRTWDLIAGRSLFGVSGDVNASHTRTFTGRRGSNSCADPKSDIVLSLAGGNPVSGNNTNEVWYSSNGFDWIQKSRGATFSPPRHFCSCDIDEMGHAFVIGGHARNDATGMDYLLDDIWMTNVLWPYNSFTRVTEHAPFGPREEHLVLVINSTALKTELIYVIGGKVTCNVGSADCYDGTNANDVWVSSDYAKSWIKLPTTPWGPRWGHTGLATNDGVLLVIGGLDSLTSRYADMYTHQDIWASFDGGISWKQCMTNETGWIRGESSVVINPRGQMIATSGYFYAGTSQTRYNDVWRSTFSVEDTSELAKRCGGMSVIPAAGPGMTRWPGSTPDTNIISFTPLTRRAPWSPRIQPAMFLQNNPRTYVNPNDGSTASTGPDWLLMFEGSLTADGQNENDVYASANNGNDWVLISGIAQRGLAGRTESASPHTSFESRGAAGNCENPTNDDVYSLAGTKTWPNGTTEYTTDVWYSSDAIIWTKRPVTSKHYSPGRYFTSCDIDNKGLIYLIGGQTASGFLNDIWTSSNAGVSWNLITRAAKFAPRSEHAVQIVHSDHYKKDLVYVIGGFTTGGVLNDVWVSSNSKDWKQIRSTKTAFSPRWGHTALVTNRGMLIVAGGTDGAYISPEDFWVSLNGGKDWTSCKLAVNGGIIRGEQAAVLTYDEKILIGNGYKYSPGFRTEYSDLWISDMSFKDPKSQALRSACPGLVVPSTIGYIDSNWEPVDPDDPDDDSSTGDFEVSSTGSSGTSSSGGLSTTVIIAIIVVVVLVLGVGLYVYRHHTQTGSWNPFSSEPPRQVGNIIDTSALFAGQDSSSSSLPASQTRTDSSSTQMSNF